MGRIRGNELFTRAIFEPLEFRRLLSATLVKDIAPLAGPTPADRFSWSSAPTPGAVAHVGGLNLFSANDGRHGHELWRTDGTAAGTFMVADLARGAASSGPGGFIAFGDHAYFTTNSGLWRTDGTARGTSIVQLDAQSPGKPGRLQALNGALYYSDTDASGAARLWRIGGAAQHTRLVQQRGPAPNDNPGSIGSLKELGGALVFAQQGAEGSQSLWRTDGTPNGTYALRELYVFSHSLARLGDALYFFSGGSNGKGTALWRTDGTTDGTTIVTVLSRERRLNLRLGPASGNLLYFTGYDEVNGSELWKSDGTAAGTGLVKDLWVGKGSRTPDLYYPELEWPPGEGPICHCSTGVNWYGGPNDSAPGNFAATSGGLFFTASDAEGLWAYYTDGTAEGTIRLPFPGPQQRVTELRTVGDTVFVAVQSPMFENGAIYATDGMVSGTRLVWAASSRQSSYVPATNISALSEVNGSLFFAGYTFDTGKELRRLDATGGITGVVHDDPNGNGVRDPSELLLPGWRVFIDRNRDGTFNKGEPFAYTDAQGRYSFSAYAEGDYVLGLSAADGFTAVNPAAAPVRNGRTTWRDVGATRVDPRTASISGNVFNDANFDGTFVETPDEQPYAGVRVYLDLNRNGIYTRGEPTTFSDADGNYRIDNVLPGEYRVAIPHLGDGHEYTLGMDKTLVVLPGSSHDVDFGIGYDGGNGMIHGVVFNDRDGDGKQDGNEPGLAGVTLSLTEQQWMKDGIFGRTAVTDAGGYYKFVRLRRGDYTLSRGWPQGDWTGDQQMRAVPLAPGRRALESWAFQEMATASISGATFLDRNGNGAWDGAADAPAPGWWVYADLDRDGKRDASEPAALTAANGGYKLDGLLSGTYLVRFAPTDNEWTFTHGGRATEIVLPPAGAASLNVGASRPPSGVITGTVHFDRDGDANVTGDGDPGKSGVTVYLDLNGNRTYDAGTDRTAVTDAQGRYRFNNVSSGTLVVIPIAPTGWAMTSLFGSVVVADDTTTEFHPLGVSNRLTLFGRLFHDVNKDGKLVIGHGDRFLANYTVYIDADNDAKLDSGESSAQTNTGGQFTFAALPLGTYVVRFIRRTDDVEHPVVAGSMTVTLPRVTPPLVGTIFFPAVTP